MGLKIAFFGSSLVSSYWNGAATYYRGLIRELYNRGHRTTFYEPDAYGRQQNRDMENPSGPASMCTRRLRNPSPGLSRMQRVLTSL